MEMVKLPLIDDLKRNYIEHVVEPQTGPRNYITIYILSNIY